MANQCSISLTASEAIALEKQLETTAGFCRAERAYASFCFEKQDVNVAFYPKKGRLLIQGKGTNEFLEHTLLLTPDAIAPAMSRTLPALVDTTPHFGVDESGKGDYFGPLVIAGVYSDEKSAHALIKLGCRDSKQIADDSQIIAMANKIKKVPGVAWEVVCIGPARYNELYTEIGNLNRLLAWGHARVIAALHEKVPACPRALSDQFANAEACSGAAAYPRAAGAANQSRKRCRRSRCFYPCACTFCSVDEANRRSRSMSPPPGLRPACHPGSTPICRETRS